MPKYKLCNTYSFEKLDEEKLLVKVKEETNKRNKLKTNKPINIIPLGSGSTGNSFYIEIGEHKILIDMGIGMRKVKEALSIHNRSLVDIEAILLTHSHSDHRSAIKAICNNTNCCIYATSDTFENIKNIDYKADNKVLEYDKKEEIVKGLYINAFKTDHDAYGSCGFIIESEGYKVGYATDLGIIRKSTLELLAGSDVIILESNHDEQMLINGIYDHYLKQRILSRLGHLSNRQSLEFQKLLYKLGTNNFLLAHLSRENNTPEIVKEEAIKEHSKDVNIYVCPIESNELLSY